MHFKHITPADYPALKRFFARQPYPLCSYSLSSLLVWSNKVYQPFGAVEGDTLIIYAEYPAQREKRHLILPISSSTETSPEKLYDLASSLDLAKCWFVPQNYLQHYGRERIEARFDVVEQPEYEDYIYLTEDLARLCGNKYAKKRNLIKQFERTYVDRGRATLETITTGHAEECIEFLEIWCEQRDCDADPEEDLACEKIAVINTFENFEVLEVAGILIRIDGQVSAFAVASALMPDMGVLHFEKAYTDIKGLYQYLDNRCAGTLFDGRTYINKESDMNIPGLAKSKKSYHPVRRVKSYELTLK